MRLLLDTHTALFAWLASSRLSPAAREILADPANEFLFSQISSLEICLKYRLGKLELPRPPEVYIPSRVEALEFILLPLSNEAIYGLGALPQVHRDPFDLLLAATARHLAVPLLSADAVMSDLGAERIW